MSKELYEFFKRCEDMKNAIGGCIMVSKNKDTGYGCNGIFQIIETSNGFKLIKEVDGMIDKQDFDFESVIFNDDTIVKASFGADFGAYANIYIDDLNYIHVHMHFLD